MPYAFKKPCRFPGCGRLTHDKYCEEHQKLVDHEYNTKQRNPETYKRYNSRWRKISKLYLAAHPLCAECTKYGRVTAATEVHHVVELADGGTHDSVNLMALCKGCHSRIGNKFHSK
jgi:5-methylcytosine-specific restriction protein A